MTTALKTTAWTLTLAILLSFAGARTAATPATKPERQTIAA